eukprot:g34033.t1
MVDSCRTYPLAGVAAIVREPLLRNPHLSNHRCDWLSEGRAMAVGLTRVGDVLGGGALGWMLPQELARRAAVDVRFTATVIQRLKMVVLRPNKVHQLEDAQVCGGILSARTPAQMEFHIGPRILRRGLAGQWISLWGLLLALAKLAVEGAIMADFLPFFRVYVRAWVSLKKEHA